MKKMKLSELKGTEILAKSIMTWDYQIILPEGAILKKEFFSKIEEQGILEVYVRVPEEEEEDIVLLKTNIADSVKSKVKDILERHTYRNNAELIELQEAADEIIEGVLEEEEVVEYLIDIRKRSKDIYEHSINVCSMATLTALHQKLDTATVRSISIACLLHDIGLRYMGTGYEDKVEEEMSSEELAEYRKHPVYGYTSLKDESWIPELSKQIILQHHEMLDGSGFPLHPTIAQIPVPSRIVQVCDTFDEMVCGICRKQYKVYEVVEYLRGFKNIKFDATIVDAFLSFTAVYPTGSRVITSDGEEAIVVSQNHDFPDRPVLQVLKDKNGKDLPESWILDLVKVLNVTIEREI